MKYQKYILALIYCICCYSPMSKLIFESPGPNRGLLFNFMWLYGTKIKKSIKKLKYQIGILALIYCICWLYGTKIKKSI